MAVRSRDGRGEGCRAKREPDQARESDKDGSDMKETERVSKRTRKNAERVSVDGVGASGTENAWESEQVNGSERE